MRAHELGHLMLRRSGLCLEEGGNESEGERVENWCNAFAANLVASEYEVRRLTQWREINHPIVEFLARKFGVSRLVVNDSKSGIRPG